MAGAPWCRHCRCRLRRPAAVVGIVLAIRLMRGRGRVGPAVYFGGIAGGSGVVLVLDVVGETGPEPWALPLLVNAVACVVVTVLAVRSHSGSA